MNQDLMILRGEYLTLQEQYKKNTTEIKSLAESIKNMVQPFTRFGFGSSFIHNQTSPETVENITHLSERLHALTQECHSIHARLEELKPMTGL